MPTISGYLAIYLNDHLAGTTGGVELARRSRDSNSQDETFAEPLRQLCAEIEEDREALERIVDRLQISRSHLKPAGAWVAEKLGRLKPNGQLRGYSPLSRLLELEGLAMGITGKKELWETLAKFEDGGDAECERLVERAAAQRAVVEDLHELAISRLRPSGHPARLPGGVR